MQATHNQAIGLKTALLAMPRVGKRVLALAVDVALCVLTVWLAYYLRLDVWVRLTGAGIFQPQWAVLASLFISLPLFITHGFYRLIFRYSGTAAMHMVLRAFALYAVLYMTVVTAVGLPGVPRSVGIIQPMLLLLGVGATRGLARYWLGGDYQSIFVRMNRPKAVIYGAGRTGRQLAGVLAGSHEMQVIAFIDDDERLRGQVLQGLPIHGLQDLPGLVQSSDVRTVLLAMPSLPRQRRNAILADLRPIRVAVRTLPSLSEMAQGRLSSADLQELDIDDLLGREAVTPNHLLLSASNRGKTVLVTGAGGSIGSELCRQILGTEPKQLLLVEVSEFALYQIHKYLLEFLSEGSIEEQLVQATAHVESNFVADKTLQVSGVEVVPLLASVCDEGRMHEIMNTWKPHTVYHAAAYKHVPLVEHNPAEGVRNNVWGTRICAEAAVRNGVQNFVLISTDKAVRPTNIMGATKRLAEMVLQALAQQRSATTFSMVRFGNVLGSSGSVVPLFREQIKNGGPITLTHLDITRYFMTIPEAAQLVIQAGAMGQGGDVFVLDMGQPVKIIDLARRMVELSGLTLRDENDPSGDIDLVVTGLRPGEKLFEELLIGDNPQATEHPRIMKAQEQFLDWPELQVRLQALNQAVSTNDVPAIRSMLQQMVSGYQPTGEVVDWVHLAQKRVVSGDSLLVC